MQPPDILHVFLDPLEKGGFPYMVTGSVAAIFFGVPRITYDVDLVLDISMDQAEDFTGIFPPSEYYCPPLETVQAEISRGGAAHFNLIHHATGFKADIYPSKDWLHRWGMQRRKKLSHGTSEAWVAPVEYVIVMKLEYFVEGGSEKHLIDIRNMWAVEGEGADLEWIRARVAERGLEEAFRRLGLPDRAG